MTTDDQLKKRLEHQARRMKKAEEDQSTLIAQTVFVGTLGLIFVLPVIGGAYLGHWIDSNITGYSVRWTISLILLGVIIGATNVYLYIRE